jgi:hypothetical protein
MLSRFPVTFRRTRPDRGRRDRKFEPEEFERRKELPAAGNFTEQDHQWLDGTAAVAIRVGQGQATWSGCRHAELNAFAHPRVGGLQLEGLDEELDWLGRPVKVIPPEYAARGEWGRVALHTGRRAEHSTVGSTD